jgi:23S rRNA (cytosine1962-C5)-methyltransferase
MIPTVRLKSGREKPLLRRHPWVFSGAIAGVEGNIEPGQTVQIVDSSGNFLGFGAYSPESQIRVRVWSWQKDSQIGEDFFRDRLHRAIQMRQDWIDISATNSYRLFHAESDGLPGLIVDRYNDVLVVQALSAGIEYWLKVIVELLVDLTGIQEIYERSDVEVRTLEGLPTRIGQLHSQDSGGFLPQEKSSRKLKIRENGIDYWVDVIEGHKTGFYVDQRSNRSRVRQIVKGKTVLDCFSYTGGFSLSALAGGALSALAVDSSTDALQLAQENLELNGFEKSRFETRPGDVFEELRLFRDQDRKFDMIILDPPKFAPTAAQAQQAARGYKDINLLAFKLLNPGGLLVTFSCSGGISADLFQKIVAGAALDAQVDAQIVERLFQGSDHPVSLNFPEGAYLKGLICRL